MRPFWMIGLAVLCLWHAPARAQSPAVNDLRTLRVGMPVTDLPARGYADLTCGGGGGSLTGWQHWRDCTPNAGGSREISFRYDDNPEHDTVVSGQPVLLSLAIREDGVVQAITMRSDPSGRVFLRKRGVHFGERVMSHYGADAWNCKEGEPAASEEVVGNLFIRQHCEKTLGDRFLVVDRELFRRAGQPSDKFVSQSVFTVSLVNSHVP